MLIAQRMSRGRVPGGWILAGVVGTMLLGGCSWDAPPTADMYLVEYSSDCPAGLGQAGGQRVFLASVPLVLYGGSIPPNTPYQFKLEAVEPPDAVEFGWETHGNPPGAVETALTPGSSATLYRSQMDDIKINNLKVYAVRTDFQSVDVTMSIGSSTNRDPLGRWMVTVENRCFAEPPGPPSERIDLIVFARGAGDIWTTDTAGNTTALTTDESRDRDPAWSPDRQEIAFVSDREVPGGDYFDVHTMGADGDAIQQVSFFLADGRSASDPAWSPTERKIAVAVSSPLDTTDSDIYIIDLSKPIDATDYAVRLTSGPEHDYSPSWSADGTEIVFARAGGTSGTYRARADGPATPIPVATPISTLSGALDWRFSDRIAVQSYDFGTHNVRILSMNAAGANAGAITADGNHIQDLSPSWSPDGTRLVFVRQESLGAPQRLCIVGANDPASAREIPNQQGDAEDPDW